jgi:DNA-directed RNA polymerase subunit H (RpoH/RPB5)
MPPPPLHKIDASLARLWGHRGFHPVDLDIVYTNDAPKRQQWYSMALKKGAVGVALFVDFQAANISAAGAFKNTWQASIAQKPSKNAITLYALTRSDALRHNKEDALHLILITGHAYKKGAPSVRKDVSDTLATLNKADPELLRVELWHVDQLSFCLEDNKMVPHHRILSPEERDAVRRRHCLSRDSELPAIHPTDPMARWIYAQPGDFVEISTVFRVYHLHVRSKRKQYQLEQSEIDGTTHETD